MGSLWNIRFGFKDRDLTLPFLCPSYPFIHARLAQAEATSLLILPSQFPAQSPVYNKPQQGGKRVPLEVSMKSKPNQSRKGKPLFFKAVYSIFLYRIIQIIFIL